MQFKLNYHTTAYIILHPRSFKEISHLQIKEQQRQLTSRDGTAAALKAKVAELYVSSETAAQSLAAAQREAVSLRHDVSASNNTRDWCVCRPLSPTTGSRLCMNPLDQNSRPPPDRNG